MSKSVRLLGLSGSLRRESHATAVLRTLSARLSGDVSLDLFPLHDVPLYNQDEDSGVGPAAVSALRSAIAGADGLVLSSPEYNYGIPGVLKNALDWASRPYGKSSLLGKPVAVMTISPAFTGGVRAQAQILETLIGTQSRVVPGPQVVIGLSNDKIKDGHLVDEPSITFALAAIDGLVKEIQSRR